MLQRVVSDSRSRFICAPSSLLLPSFRTALHFAVVNENDTFEECELLLQAGADVDAADIEGATPLHQAVLSGDDNAVKWLLRHGARETATNMSGQSPRQLAESFGMTHVVAVFDSAPSRDPHSDAVVDVEEVGDVQLSSSSGSGSAANYEEFLSAVPPPGDDAHDYGSSATTYDPIFIETAHSDSFAGPTPLLSLPPRELDVVVDDSDDGGDLHISGASQTFVAHSPTPNSSSPRGGASQSGHKALPSAPWEHQKSSPDVAEWREKSAGDSLYRAGGEGGNLSAVDSNASNWVADSILLQSDFVPAPWQRPGVLGDPTAQALREPSPPVDVIACDTPGLDVANISDNDADNRFADAELEPPVHGDQSPGRHVGELAIGSTHTFDHFTEYTGSSDTAQVPPLVGDEREMLTSDLMCEGDGVEFPAHFNREHVGIGQHVQGDASREDGHRNDTVAGSDASEKSLPPPDKAQQGSSSSDFDEVDCDTPARTQLGPECGNENRVDRVSHLEVLDQDNYRAALPDNAATSEELSLAFGQVDLSSTGLNGADVEVHAPALEHGNESQFEGTLQCDAYQENQLSSGSEFDDVDIDAPGHEGNDVSILNGEAQASGRPRENHQYEDRACSPDGSSEVENPSLSRKPREGLSSGLESVPLVKEDCTLNVEVSSSDGSAAEEHIHIDHGQERSMPSPNADTTRSTGDAHISAASSAEKGEKYVAGFEDPLVVEMEDVQLDVVGPVSSTAARYEIEQEESEDDDVAGMVSLDINPVQETQVNPRLDQRDDLWRADIGSGELDVTEPTLYGRTDECEEPSRRSPVSSQRTAAFSNTGSGAKAREVAYDEPPAKSERISELSNSNTQACADMERAIGAASEMTNFDVICELLETFDSIVVAVRSSARHGQTALHRAAFFGRVDVVQKILAIGGAPIDARETLHECTALHLASKKGRSEVVSLLVKAGGSAIVDLADKYGNTALHMAAAGGHLESGMRLIGLGADPSRANEDFRTPCDEAVQYEHTATADMLTVAVARATVPEEFKSMLPDLSLSSVGPCDLMEIAIGFPGQDSDLEAIVALVRTHGRLVVNYKSPHHGGQTCLHRAVFHQDLDMVRNLLVYGADVDAKEDRYHSTAMHSAAASNAIGVVDVLVEFGADVNVVSRYGTPLHLACENGHLAIVQVLLMHGAKRSVQNLEGKTALYIAQEQCHDDIERLLRRV
jgi:ankyrin repeat protein